nr:tyrosine/dopa decarboxylase 5 [Quercus suber]
MGSLNSENVTSHTSSSNISPLDPEEFRRQGHMIIDFLADYYRDVEKYPVLSQVEPGYLQKRLPKSTPHNPEPIETVLQDVQEHIVPRLTHWQSPNFFAYFQCTSSIAGFLGEMLSTGFNVSTSYALSPDSLRAQICEDVEACLVPLFLCATVGTTPTAAIDPLESLCAVSKDYGMWVHVDAAYAGSACICPEFRPFIDGVEGTNSFSLNAHKWFLTSLDCCCLWVKDPSSLIKSLSTNPEFLRNKASDSKQVVDYKDWQITLSRRFRSLKLWFVLRSYGVANLRSFMRNHVKMANLFEGLVAMDKRFEIVVPTNFAMVCFRILPSALSETIYKNGKLDIVSEKHAIEANRKLLESINMSGCVFMTHAMVEGVYVIRFAVGATLVKERHVITAWKVVQEHANVILST